MIVSKVRGFFARARHDLVEIPPPLEGNAVQKSDRRDSDLNRAGIQLLLIRQIKLVIPDVFGPEMTAWEICQKMPGEHRKLAET